MDPTRLPAAVRNRLSDGSSSWIQIQSIRILKEFAWINSLLFRSASCFWFSHFEFGLQRQNRQRARLDIYALNLTMSWKGRHPSSRNTPAKFEEPLERTIISCLLLLAECSWFESTADGGPVGKKYSVISLPNLRIPVVRTFADSLL